VPGSSRHRRKKAGRQAGRQVCNDHDYAVVSSSTATPAQPSQTGQAVHCCQLQQTMILYRRCTSCNMATAVCRNVCSCQHPNSSHDIHCSLMCRPPPPAPPTDEWMLVMSCRGSEGSEWGMQLLVMWPLAYICICTYFALFRLNAFNYNKLMPRATTGGWVWLKL
jgi:hypothetical protein